MSSSGSFNYTHFKMQLARKELTKKKLAILLGITESTLYRKLKRGGDFNMTEILIMIGFFGQR